MKTRTALSLAGAALVAVVAAAAAQAHAELIGTTPRDGQVLREAPPAVVLRFDEPLESSFATVEVRDPFGRRVDDRQLTRVDPRTLRLTIARKLPNGTYRVDWHVVSEDSHPIDGSFVFSVGAPSAGGAASGGAGLGPPDYVDPLFGFVRFLDFALLLLVAGGACALVWPLAAAPPLLRSRLLTLLAAWAGALVFVALAGIVLQGAKAGGYGVGDALRWNSISSVLDTRFGRAWLFQAAAAGLSVLLALAARKRRSLIPALVAAGGALVMAPSLSGHAGSGSNLAAVADLAHLAAAAVWTGGLALVFVALLVAGSERWQLAATAVPRFSRLAVVSVAVLISAGAINAYEELDSWSELWETTYGRLLLVKLALVVPLLALGVYNNRYSVPQLRSAASSPAERRRFLRTAAGELALIVGVVAVTAALVSEPPGRTASNGKGPRAETPSQQQR
jgi:copper transport protein